MQAEHQQYRPLLPVSWFGHRNVGMALHPCLHRFVTAGGQLNGAKAWQAAFCKCSVE